MRVDREIHVTQTPYQNLQIFENRTFGRVLALDGVVQTTEADEFIYHEMLAHPPILAHGGVRKVLIIGGGDGGCAEEVLKHDVETVVMVEIDGAVVAAAKAHLAMISNGAFDDPRLSLIIGDGARYMQSMAQSVERFDLIIIDSTDPIGPGVVLFEDAFYTDCQRVLAPGGILVTQNGVPFVQRLQYQTTGATRAKLFRHAGFYFATVPSYCGGPLAFGWASDTLDLAQLDLAQLEAAHDRFGTTLRYYNPLVHLGAFATPNFLRL
ncbi:Spermidine synthase [Enhygromyxa salina]|uniref:Polyamine aminopropyltransferase n=2 Tax=Enhygromyxa salina TaxID=215803 RepID=A0A2S9YC79_9BACT|nr:Spermidine synthase [Enhygromyxa salina]